MATRQASPSLKPGSCRLSGSPWNSGITRWTECTRVGRVRRCYPHLAKLSAWCGSSPRWSSACGWHGGSPWSPFLSYRFVLRGYDEPGPRSSSTHPICLMSADGGQTWAQDKDDSIINDVKEDQLFQHGAASDCPRRGDVTLTGNTVLYSSR
jgi:hypothetical protein